MNAFSINVWGDIGTDDDDFYETVIDKCQGVQFLLALFIAAVFKGRLDIKAVNAIGGDEIDFILNLL